MGLDIWFKDDIANILKAANEANLSALSASDDALGWSVLGQGGARELRHAYRRGFVSALVTLAVAFGLPAPDLEESSAVSTGTCRGSRPRESQLYPPALVGGRRWER